MSGDFYSLKALRNFHFHVTQKRKSEPFNFSSSHELKAKTKHVYKLKRFIAIKFLAAFL